MNLSLFDLDTDVNLFFWREGNEAMRQKEYVKAIEYFEHAKKRMPNMAKIIDSNIELAQRKQRSSLPCIPVLNAETIDIVVPVYNALEDVKNCLVSLEKYTDNFKVHIFVINDASDEATTQYLQEFIKDKALFTLIENPQNLGYTKSVNIGLRSSTADYVITQNSDTIVSKGWLRGMIRCMKSDPKIGIVGPLSNAGGWQSVPAVKSHLGGFIVNQLPVDFSINTMADAIKLISEQAYPRIPIINGFCFMIRRTLINVIGYMDELNFPIGYGEENDYCIRANNANFETAVSDDVYVFHAKSKSFGNKKCRELSLQGSNTLKYYYENYTDIFLKASTCFKLNHIREKIYNTLYSIDLKKKSLNTIKNKKILVHLHLFYEEQVEYFLEKLKNITVDYDFYVTLVSKIKSTEAKILDFKNDTNIIYVKNSGYDIYPFLKILEKINLDNYKFVMKLHTKNFRNKVWRNKNYEFVGYEWRNYLVDAFLSSKKQFNNVLDVFKHVPAVGIVGSKELMRSYENKRQEDMTRKVCTRLNLQYNNSTMFICGTMFIIRSSLLNILKNASFSDSDFDDVSSSSNVGTLAHSLETIFGIIVKNEKKFIYGITKDEF